MQAVKLWLNEVNTTSFRIVTSVVIAAAAVLMILAAVLFFHWEPSDKQVRVLEGLALVVLTMMGFDVASFIAKRFSDVSYAAAKTPSPPVTVQTGSVTAGTTPTVTVGSSVTVGSPVPPSPPAPTDGDEPVERPRFPLSIAGGA